MELSDEQVMLKAWEVAVRRGWEFVIISLMRAGVDLRSRGLSDIGVAGLCGELEGYSHRGKFSSSTSKSECDGVMVSQESEEEDEKGEEASCKPSSNGAEKKGLWWRECVVHRKSSTTLKSLMRESGYGPDVVDADLKLRIKLFVSKANSAFNDCFLGKDIELASTSSARSKEGSHRDAETQILPTSATQVSPPKFLQSNTLGSKVGHISSRFAPHLGDGSPSVAVVKPTTLTLTDSAEEFLWPVNLAAHVSKELRETVVALKFFNMFSLLPGWSADNLPVVRRSISEWQKGFSIMGSILLEDAPDKMKGFFNYGEIINKAHDAVDGDAWIKYDEEFRRLKEIQPDMNWALIHSQLWLQIIPPARAALEVQKKANEGRSTSSGSDENVSKDKGRPLKKATKGTCLRYNNGVCKGTICNFLHCCSICGASHPKVKCPKRSDDSENTQPQKKQQIG